MTALTGIDLDVQPREFVSLIGPSGCGKSTLLRIIGDLIEPSEGTVDVNGKPAHRARLDHDYGIVFQERGPLRLAHRLEERRAAARAAQVEPRRSAPRACTRCSTSSSSRASSDHHPWQLSGGMQQRVSIARALSFDPALLLDGRAVRRARRDDARAAEHGAAADLGRERLDDRLRHALDPRGGLPLDAGRGDVGAAGADRRPSSRSTCRSPAPGGRARSRASSSS